MINNQSILLEQIESNTTYYHIYHDGHIERINYPAIEFAQFIYHDENGDIHDLGKSEYILANKYENYKEDDPKTGKSISKYRQITGHIYLIDQRKHNRYENGTIGYQWKVVSDEERYYLSGLALAAVLGAMCNISRNNFIGSGFSLIDGSSGKESISHINGINGDFRYLGINDSHMVQHTNTSDDHFDWAGNVEFVNALYKFGYTDFLSQPVIVKNNELLPHSRACNGHNNHLHLQGFKPNVTDIAAINPNNTNFTELDAKEALRAIFDKYGYDIAIIVEKLYRAETAHLKSKQYKACGTPGMEVHGAGPYYGWDDALFIEEPTGTWSAYENKGLSDKGGNVQITTKKKSFVRVSKVLVGMTYVAEYIKKYDGNYARWFSKDVSKQEVYRQTLAQIHSRIVNKF